jgi:phage shock protein PspC (stress-responsive transcriptional regulator)
MKKLRRSRNERVLFGVCGGLGRYLGVDPDLVRVGWILLIAAGGVGILPYLAAIFLVEEGTEDPEPGRDRLAPNLGLLLIAVSALVFLRVLGVEADWGFAFWGWKFLVPLLLLFGGILMVWPGTRTALGFASEHRVLRATSDRVLAGVCGGMAAAAGVDPNVVRIAFVLAGVLTSGLAGVVYILLIVVLPEEPVTAAPGPVAPGQGPAEPGR